MTTSARADTGIDTRLALCTQHPEDHQELFFCFDCTHAFCTYCQLVDDSSTNHKSHRTIKMNELLGNRKERIAQLRFKLEEYTIKYDKIANETSKLADEKNQEILALKTLIDQFTQKVHKEIDVLKDTATQFIESKASEMWEKSPATSLQKAASETLSKICEVRASLEDEIRRAEADELVMAERSAEMDALGDQLSAFLQSQLELPDISAFDLSALRTRLQSCITQLESEVSRSKEVFVRSLDTRVTFPNPDKVRLVEQRTLHAQNLVLPCDESKTPNINGVAYEENNDIIYFTDLSNLSKIKSFNLKTRKISEVYSAPSHARLYGLFAASDPPNSPFILTTERTSSTPAVVRVKLLRRNMSGQLSLVQSITLEELETYCWASFASASNGSIFCALYYSKSLHELCRAPISPAAPFASKAHRLPDNIQYICGLQCAGEQRLVASFADDSVRVYRLIDGALTEVQRLPAPTSDWTPRTLVGLSDGGICICSRFQDTTDATIKYAIELSAADASGTLSSPRRLAQFTNGVQVWCHLRPPVASDGSHRIIVAEYSNRTTVVALRVFVFQQD